MAATEKSCLLQKVDGSGNVSLLYPVTTAENVDGLDEAIAAKVSGSGGASAATANVLLPASGWAGNLQTVAVSGVTAACTVIVGGDDLSEPEYSNCEVCCSGQAAGSLTFSCTYLPMEDVAANVLILK